MRRPSDPSPASLSTRRRPVASAALLSSLGCAALAVLSCTATMRFGARYDLALVRVESEEPDGSTLGTPSDDGMSAGIDNLLVRTMADDRGFHLGITNRGGGGAVVYWDDAYVIPPSGGEARLLVGTTAREEYRQLPREAGADLGESRTYVLSDRVRRQEVPAGTGAWVIAVPQRMSGSGTVRMFDFSRSCEDLLAQRVTLVVPLELDGNRSVSRLVFALSRVEYAPEDPTASVSARVCSAGG